jgi:FAD synthetase
MKKRILCSGTFDNLHTGHIDYFKTAKDLAKDSVLIVIVARDDNSYEIKGKHPENTERARLKRIKSLDFVDEAVLGYPKPKIIDRIVSLKPDIIALGYDQWAKEEWLSSELEKHGLSPKIIRMKKFPRNEISKL